MLDNAKEALLGYSVANQHLPCPDKTSGANNGINDNPNDGIEDFNAVTGDCITYEGNLPSSTLGIAGNDAWGKPLIYRVTNAFGQRLPLAQFNLATNGSIRVCNDSSCASPRVTDTAVAVVVSKGKNRGICSTAPSPPACADERANDDGNSDFVSHEPRASSAANPNSEYDDIVVWISQNVLFNRMVSAGKLP